MNHNDNTDTQNLLSYLLSLLTSPTSHCVSLTGPSVCLCPRAADWKLDAPDWTGRMRLTARGKVVYVKLEDKASGER